MLDDKDRRLLRLLQKDPAQPAVQLAENARVPLGTVTRRLERLREARVLQGTEALINWKALGYAVDVSLRIALDKTYPRAFDDFLAAARQVPEVIELQTFLGRVDVRLQMIARDMPHYQQLYRDHILTLPHIADIEALMQVATVQDRRTLPL